MRYVFPPVYFSLREWKFHIKKKKNHRNKQGVENMLPLIKTTFARWHIKVSCIFQADVLWNVLCAPGQRQDWFMTQRHTWTLGDKIWTTL